MLARRQSEKARRTNWRLAVESLESRLMLHAEGAISGYAYIDTDGDGLRDANESGIPGVVVRLSQSDLSVDLSTLTDDQGRYSFAELDPGTYQLAARQSAALLDGQDSTLMPEAVSNDDLFANLVLADDQESEENNFGERGLRAEFINILWFLASTPPPQQMLRETIALGEELAGDQALAASIRAGGNEVPEFTNNAPIATDDVFSVAENEVLAVAAAGLLANDSDPDGDLLTATLVGQASNGSASINNDGSFTYTPDTGFTGIDSFTYQASDSTATSNLATVRINVNSAGTNQSPVATDDAYTVRENGVFSTGATHGLLANDTDPDGDTLTANLVTQPTNGSVTLNADGSFTYTPDSDFSGEDSFTYRVADDTSTSNLATVSIAVTPVDSGNQLLFGPATPGQHDDPGLLGIRTDLVPGAPPITRDHADGNIDYTGYSNPPTYGPHHGFDPEGVDANPGITPRPTGIYTTEQPEEDLLHNLEHGHVWISYNPNLIGSSDLAALEQLVRDGSPNPNGGGVGVILTPRAANDATIALASWARLLTLDEFDPATIRNFVEINRGKAPEGFITP